MNLLSTADLEFERQFAAGQVRPEEFDHLGHLRLAYIQLSRHGADGAAATFRGSLLGFLRHHRIDAGKFHETLTQAWLLAVWHFMHRAGPTADGGEFLQSCTVLHDPRVMMTHYSKDVLFSEKARARFVSPDLEPIPRRG